VLQEARAERLDRLLHPLAQPVQRADALVPRALEPGLQPALGRLLRLDPTLVADQPEEAEVGEELPLHDGLEIELDVRLPGEAVVVAEEAQDAAVGDERPEVLVGPVQELLHQAVRRRPRRARHALRLPVDGEVGTDQVDRRAIPLVGDGERLPLDLHGLRPHEPAVPQLVEEGEKPPVTGEAGGGVGGGTLLQRILVRRPEPEEAVPGAVDRLADPLVLGEVVGALIGAAKIRIARRDPVQDLGGEEPALRLHRGKALPAHAAPPATGRNTYTPTRSGGRWGSTSTERPPAPGAASRTRWCASRRAFP
jgi:hypothetical protein